jgi:hypothetical protein
MTYVHLDPLPFLQSLLSGYSPAELMQCLCELTHEAKEIVLTDTENVDLSRDAKLLRWVELLLSAGDHPC